MIGHCWRPRHSFSPGLLLLLTWRLLASWEMLLLLLAPRTTWGLGVGDGDGDEPRRDASDALRFAIEGERNLTIFLSSRGENICVQQILSRCFPFLGIDWYRYHLFFGVDSMKAEFFYSVAMLRSHLLCDNPTKVETNKRLKNTKCFLLKLIWLLQNADRKWIWQCATVQNIQKCKVELFWLDKNTCAWKTA